MVAIYVRWIKAGRMTIDQVPEHWRTEVEEKLKQEAAEKNAEDCKEGMPMETEEEV